MSGCHETYLICQAVPSYRPPDDEVSDFKLRVMARIHTIHEDHKIKTLAKIMGG